MVSSMGYVVLSGKMQVDKQDTTFLTYLNIKERWGCLDVNHCVVDITLIREAHIPIPTHTKLLSVMQHIIVDQQVVTEVVEIGGHVAKKSSDLCSKVDDVSGAVLLENGLSGSGIAIALKKENKVEGSSQDSCST